MKDLEMLLFTANTLADKIAYQERSRRKKSMSAALRLALAAAVLMEDAYEGEDSNEK